MSRRVGLPGAAELFRPTAPAPGEEGAPAQPASPTARGSGRIRHDEKITVYVSAEELVALETARLTLRASYGVAVDRGRIVREAIAAALADFAQHADDAELVKRLTSP